MTMELWCSFIVITMALSYLLAIKGDHPRQKITFTPDKPRRVYIGENVSLTWRYYKPPNLKVEEVVFGRWKSTGILDPKLVVVIGSSGNVLVRSGYESSVGWAGNLTSSLAVFVLYNVQPADGNVEFGIQVEFGLGYNPLTDVVRLQLETKRSAENIGKTTVNSGDTANLFYNSVNESSKNFRRYRVKKNNVPFRFFHGGSDTSECTSDGLLKDFCDRTEFKRHNGSHLLLKIKDTVVNDSGVYSVHGVFKRLNSDTSEEIVLEVTHLNVTGSSETTLTGSSTAASSSRGSARAPVSVVLQFATMFAMISI